MKKLSKETSVVRSIVLPLIPAKCHGIDIGFGGDKIREDFIGCDLPRPYGEYCGYHIDLPCDVTKGIPAKNDTFDVVYSSHLIEDFEDTCSVLKEFFRICKPKGKIILVFPDQAKYVESCAKNGTEPNKAHKIPDMGIIYMLKVLSSMNAFATEEIFTHRKGYNCVIAFDLKK